MAILSISSRVVYGYVGNSAMVPALQHLGLTVWPVDTVVFSNHPGHGQFRGEVRDPAALAALLRGWPILAFWRPAGRSSVAIWAARTTRRWWKARWTWCAPPIRAPFIAVTR